MNVSQINKKHGAAVISCSSCILLEYLLVVEHFIFYRSLTFKQRHVALSVRKHRKGF